MTIDFVLDTSNQHPKIKLEEQKEEFLVKYELYVDGIRYNVYGLMWAKDSKDAWDKMPHSFGGDNHTIMPTKVIGAVKDEERRNIHDKLHDIGGGIVLP